MIFRSGVPRIVNIGALLLGGLTACSSGSSGRTWFVNAAAPAGGDGAGWASAFDDLQLALGAAHGGDRIWVAQGVYTPTGPDGDRNATFLLQTGVALYGGFAGDETDLAQRDYAAHPTILSGDLDGDDGPLYAGSAENAYHVVVAVHAGPSTILDGFTIRGGRADGVGLGATPESQDQGAGLNVYHASPQVANCTFTANWSKNHGAVNDHGEESSYFNCLFVGNHAQVLGAGLYIHHESRATALECVFVDNDAVLHGGGAYSRSMVGATLSHCTFQDNRADLGAGIYLAAAGTTRVLDSTFEDNVAGLGGGGVYSDAGSPQVEGCTFTDNEAGVGVTGGGGGGGGSGGGGLWANGGSPTVRDCTFTTNAASFGGGAYFILECAALVEDCLFQGNTATEAGGLYTLGSPVHVAGCTFLDNTASGSEFSVGGGLSNYFSNSFVEGCSFHGNRAELGGGGLYSEGETPVIRDSSFCGNTAFGANEGWGGGILCGYFTHARIENCTFAGNTANLGGGVLHAVFSQAAIRDCTFAANVATTGSQMHAIPLSVPQVRNSIFWGADTSPIGDGGEVVDVSYCCVRGGYAGPGNFDADPLFLATPDPGPDLAWGTADDECGDLRLAKGSPCVDAGDNTAVPAELTTDIDGEPRFMDDPNAPDTGIGGPPVVDLGAFETPPTP